MATSMKRMLISSTLQCNLLGMLKVEHMSQNGGWRVFV